MLAFQIPFSYTFSGFDAAPFLEKQFNQVDFAFEE